MQKSGRRINPLPITILAAGALVWAVVAVVVAVGGPNHAPQIIHSTHTEHFLAFYAIGVLATAALPGLRLHWVFLAMVAAATAFGLVRWLVMQRTHGTALEDWLAEIGGGAAALIPILIGTHRQAYKSWTAPVAPAPPD